MTENMNLIKKKNLLSQDETFFFKKISRAKYYVKFSQKDSQSLEKWALAH